MGIWKYLEICGFFFKVFFIGFVAIFSLHLFDKICGFFFFLDLCPNCFSASYFINIFLSLQDFRSNYSEWLKRRFLFDWIFPSNLCVCFFQSHEHFPLRLTSSPIKGFSFFFFLDFSNTHFSFFQLQIWHPDRCSASGNSKFVEEAKKKFQAIQEAYSGNFSTFVFCYIVFLPKLTAFYVFQFFRTRIKGLCTMWEPTAAMMTKT